MGVLFIVALGLSALPLRAFSGRIPRFGHVGAVAAAVVAAGGTIAVWALYLTVFASAVRATHHESVLSAWPIAYSNGSDRVIAAPAADALVALAIVQSVLLVALLWNLHALAAALRRGVIAVVAVSCGALAIASRTADSPDPYLYVAYSLLGFRSYAPPATPFAAHLHIVNVIWGTPILPAVYGPLWIALGVAVGAPFASLAAKLLALKMLGLLSVFACALLARALKAPGEVVAGIACNPALYFTYVASAHNDLIGIDLVLGAMVVAPRSVVAAFACALGATLVKVTLLPVVLASVAFRSIRARFVFAGALCVPLIVLYAADGGLLVHAARVVTSEYDVANRREQNPFHIALAILALASMLGTLLTGRVRAQTAWAFAGLGQNLWPHYIAWGIPVALRSPRVAALFLMVLPLLINIQCQIFPRTHFLDLVSAVFVVSGIVAVAIVMRPQRLTA